MKGVGGEDVAVGLRRPVAFHVQRQRFGQVVAGGVGQPLGQAVQVFRQLGGRPEHLGEVRRQPYRVLACAGADFQQITRGSEIVTQYIKDRTLVVFGCLGERFHGYFRIIFCPATIIRW